MRRTFATIASSQPWETDLAAKALEYNTVRLIGRCTGFDEVRRLAPDVVVIGSESPLATLEVLAGWRRAGIAVLLMHDQGDPTRQRVRSECDISIDKSTHPVQVMAAISSVAAPPRERDHPIVTVTGPRGAPGRSEVALALAWAMSDELGTPATLVDLDLDAPSLSFRLGLPPFVTVGASQAGPISVAGFPPASGPLSGALAARLIATRNACGPVVVDVGPAAAVHPAGHVVLVGTPSDIGLIRLRRFLVTVALEDPILIINRASPDNPMRAALGFDAAVVIPDLGEPPIRAPFPEMVRLLQPLVANRRVESATA